MVEFTEAHWSFFFEGHGRIGLVIVNFRSWHCVTYVETLSVTEKRVYRGGDGLETMHTFAGSMVSAQVDFAESGDRCCSMFVPLRFEVCVVGMTFELRGWDTWTDRMWVIYHDLNQRVGCSSAALVSHHFLHNTTGCCKREWLEHFFLTDSVVLPFVRTRCIVEPATISPNSSLLPHVRDSTSPPAGTIFAGRVCVTAEVENLSHAGSFRSGKVIGPDDGEGFFYSQHCRRVLWFWSIR